MVNIYGSKSENPSQNTTMARTRKSGRTH